MNTIVLPQHGIEPMQAYKIHELRQLTCGTANNRLVRLTSIVPQTEQTTGDHPQTLIEKRAVIDIDTALYREATAHRRPHTDKLLPGCYRQSHDRRPALEKAYTPPGPSDGTASTPSRHHLRNFGLVHPEMG